VGELKTAWRVVVALFVFAWAFILTMAASMSLPWPIWLVAATVSGAAMAAFMYDDR
jgi:hypothetical protein